MQIKAAAPFPAPDDPSRSFPPPGVARRDVLVVGGGLVGLALALALEGSGLSVTLVEARPADRAAGSFDDRAIALSHGSARILAGMPGGETTWARLAPLATAIAQVHVSEQGRFGLTRLRADRLGVPALGYVATGGDIARVLGESVARLEEVEVRAGTALVGLEIGAAGVVAVLEPNSGAVPGGPRATGGGRCEVRARVLVAADGGQSPVRALIGVGAARHDYRQRALIANVTASESHRSTAFERFTREGPLALLPLAGRRLALVWTASPETVDELLAVNDGAFLARLQRTFGARLGRFDEVGARASFALHRAVSDAQTHARVVLVGNAANHLHPVAGQGFNLGLRDVAVLSRMLNEAAAADADPGAPELLRRYAAHRRPDQHRTAELTNGLVSLFSNDLPGLGLARNLAMVGLDLLPGLNRVLARQAMGLGGLAGRQDPR